MITCDYLKELHEDSKILFSFNSNEVKIKIYEDDLGKIRFSFRVYENENNYTDLSSETSYSSYDECKNTVNKLYFTIIGKELEK
jgi:hypothetical protein